MKLWNHAHVHWDLCCSPSLSINSRVQSEARILFLDVHYQENVKYNLQWQIASMFNHPDPPLKFWDGWWVGTTRLRKTLVKHHFHNNSGNHSRNIFSDMSFWKKSPSSFASRCCSTTHPQKKPAENHHQHQNIYGSLRLEPSLSKLVPFRHLNQA